MDKSEVIRPRILVILEAHPEAERLLRAAKRKAEKENIDWEVLHVQTPIKQKKINEEEVSLLNDLIVLAGQMGSMISRIHAKNIQDGVIRAVNNRKKNNIPIYSLKVGDARSDKSSIFAKKPLYEKLKEFYKDDLRISGIPLGVYIPTATKIARHLKITSQQIFFSLAVIVYAGLLSELIYTFRPELFNHGNRNRAFIFLIATMLAAWRGGFLAGLISGTISLLALVIIYYSPDHTLNVTNPAYIFNISLFLLCVVITSILGNKDLDYKRMLAKRSERFHALLSIHRLALNRETASETIEVIDTELEKLLRTDVVFYLPSIMNDKILEPLFNYNVRLNSAEKNALDICWDEVKATGSGTPYTSQNCKWRFEPMATAKAEIGVIGILVDEDFEVDEDFARLTQGIADQVALILERLKLEDISEENRVQAEREKLRSMLLSSVSHDLKTPLASIIGSLSVYRNMGIKLTNDQRLTLINNAIDEAQRLDSFITNILDMTRLESGKVEMKQEWINIEILINEVVKRLKDRLRGHNLSIIKPTMPVEVFADSLMTGQVVQNLLDNAAKYTNAGTNIEVEWFADNEGFKLIIRDFGKGIPEEQLEKIFDKYTRLDKRDSQVAGTGLGLAISRAVISSQGGNIFASNHKAGGAQFTITFPKARLTGGKEAA